MEQRKNITKNNYIILSFGLIILGALLMSLCTYLFIMKIETNYTYYFNIVAGMIMGAGIGMANSRVFKIEGYD
jgi:hypothetical protein